MKRILSIIGLLAIVAVSLYAQHPMLKAQIPFEFMVGAKSLPAGHYEFTLNEDFTSVIVRNLDTGNRMPVPIVTSLAGPTGDVRVTFDTVGDKKTLEAVWLADNQGYLLHATKGKHSHDIVKAATKE